VGRYAERLADQMDRLSDYLRDRDIDRLVGDAEDFARNRPEIFLSASFLAGLMAARFLRASSPQGPRGGSRRSTWEEPGLEGTPTTPTRTDPTRPPAPGVRTP
jgi:hypothetical protein